jgi:rare lipoprotein A
MAASAFGALPAAADFAEDVRRMGDPYRASQAAAPAKRVASATTLEAERNYDVRPTYRDDDDRPRAVRSRRVKASPPARIRSVRTRSATTKSAQRRTRHMRQAAGGKARPARRVLVAALPGGNMIRGVASYYYSGHTTASGARYNPEGLSAAHRSLPFGTRVRIRHLGNGRSVDVRINDRGPFIGGRVIDLSRGAARVIGMIGSGLARVSVEILGR